MNEKDVSEKQAASQQGVFLIVNRQMIPLTKPVTTLGRHLGNDIVFHEEFLSRYHAEVAYEEGKYILYDTSVSAPGSSTSSVSFSLTPWDSPMSRAWLCFHGSATWAFSSS